MAQENIFHPLWTICWNNMTLFPDNLVRTHINIMRLLSGNINIFLRSLGLHYFRVCSQMLLGRSCINCNATHQHTPSKDTADMSLYSRLHGYSFDYSLLCTLECVCFVLLLSHNRDKLSSKVSNAFSLGIYLHIKDIIGFMIPLPNDFELLIARHVSFFKNIPYYYFSHTHDLLFLDTTTST